MSLSNPLDLPLITDAQNDKHITHNDAILKLSQALGNAANISVENNDVTIPTDTAQRNKYFQISDATTAGRLVSLPALNRFYVFRALAGNAEDVNVDIDGGSSPIVFPPGAVALVITRDDGDIQAFFLAQVAAVSNFVELNDTPSNYAGAGLFLVRVNAALDGLEFVDPDTLDFGVTEFVNLTDVELDDLADGDFLAWDNDAGVWRNVLPPSGGGGGAETLDALSDVSLATPEDGDILLYNGATEEWENAPLPASGGGPVDVLTKTANHTLELTDAGALILIGDTTDLDLIVPANSGVAFPVGSQVSIIRADAGEVDVVEDSGVTVHSAETLKLRKQWSTAILTKIAADEWLLVGDLAEDV